MYEDKVYVIPNPIVDLREMKALENLDEQYERLIKPSFIAVVGEKITSLVPEKAKEIGRGAKEFVSEQDLYRQMLSVVAEAYNTMAQEIAKHTVSEKKILEKLNALDRKNEITELDEVCLLRSYKISKVVNQAKSKDLLMAGIEGGVAGLAAGHLALPGLAFNIVASTLLYFRAVQWIAMCYGYDVKHNPNELALSASVFSCALSPKQSNSDELSDTIIKFMITDELLSIKKAAGKNRWSAMIAEGPLGLLLTQICALANKSAKKALEKAGEKGLEQKLFINILEDIGDKLTLKSIKKAIPYAGGILGMLLDANQMRKVLDYADIFYHKRFLTDKEKRINLLIDQPDEKDIIYIEV